MIQRYLLERLPADAAADAGASHHPPIDLHGD